MVQKKVGKMMKKEDKSMDSCLNLIFWRNALVIGLLFLGGVVLCMILVASDNSFHFIPRPYFYNLSRPLTTQTIYASPRDDFDMILQNASMIDKTIIITSVNKAWAKPNSLMDVFLESFRIGNETRRLLHHLIIVALDHDAYAQCLLKHYHCYALKMDGVDFSGGEAIFDTPIYKEMMWRRHKLLTLVLEKGYNFVFSDADIVWFRDPFRHFYPNSDFQTSCDNYLGNSSDLRNLPSNGFVYVKSNFRTIEFYKFWFSSRISYADSNEQYVFNKIKFHPYISELGLKIKFLDTLYFNGFCNYGNISFDQICTMHANCYVGKRRKIHDLRIMLEAWKGYMASLRTNISSWAAPESRDV